VVLEYVSFNISLSVASLQPQNLPIACPALVVEIPLEKSDRKIEFHPEFNTVDQCCGLWLPGDHVLCVVGWPACWNNSGITDRLRFDRRDSLSRSLCLSDLHTTVMLSVAKGLYFAITRK